MERGKWLLELLSEEGELVKQKQKEEEERMTKSQTCIVTLNVKSFSNRVWCPSLASRRN